MSSWGSSPLYLILLCQKGPFGSAANLEFYQALGSS